MAWFCLLVFLLSTPHLRSLLGTSFNQKELPEGARTLSVVTFNCHQLIDGNKQYIDEEVINRWLAGKQIDVLFLQEIIVFKSGPTLDNLHAIQKAGNFPYVIYEEGRGLATFSKFPLAHHKTTYWNIYNGYQLTHLQLGTQTVLLANMHLQSNSITGLADEVAETGELNDKKTWLTVENILTRFRRSGWKRAAQAQEIAALLQKSNTPVIAAGDLNDVPQSFTYRVLCAGRSDTFVEAGKGIGTTYAGKIPGLRIDYLFVSPHFFTPLSHTHHRVSFSDHKYVHCNLVY